MQPLDGIEVLVAKVIRAHPEYHAVLAKRDTSEDRDYLPESGETNPFLHMGMHIALREQANTDRPAGIGKIYARMVEMRGQHEAEHAMMECLGESLWRAQRDNRAPDEAAYLECLKKIGGGRFTR